MTRFTFSSSLLGKGKLFFFNRQIPPGEPFTEEKSMPTRLSYILDRLPLPSLRTYTFFSISLVIANVFYYHHLIQSDRLILSNDTNETSTLNISTMPYFSIEYLQTLSNTVISQSLSLLVTKSIRLLPDRPTIFSLGSDQCHLLLVHIDRQTNSNVDLW